MSLKIIESGIRGLIMHLKYDYVGYILQCMNIYVTDRIPTAGVNYDKNTKRFNLYVNPKFFATLTEEQVQGVLIHEIDHILHKHVFYNIQKSDMPRWNIAMDLVINQGNNMLPEGGMTLDIFRNQGKNFEENKPTEYYYNMLLDPNSEIKMPDQGQKDDNKQGDNSGSDQCDQDGEGTGSGKSSKKGKGKSGDPKDDGQWMSVEDFLKGNKSGETTDSHVFNEGEGVDEREATDAMRDIVSNARKRMPEYSRSMERMKSVLQEIDATARKLDFKAIVKTAIRRSLPANDFARSYQRPSRRLGFKAAGKVVEQLPKLTFLFDTSGSIGPDQINDALGVIDGFFGQVSQVDIHYFHTETYKEVKKAKRGYRVKSEELESGGTDLTHSFENIIKKGSDLVVVLTDGYFGDINVDFKKVPKTVFVVDKHGDVNHPWSKKCPTYVYEV